MLISSESICGRNVDLYCLALGRGNKQEMPPIISILTGGYGAQNIEEMRDGKLTPLNQPTP